MVVRRTVGGLLAAFALALIDPLPVLHAETQEQAAWAVLTEGLSRGPTKRSEVVAALGAIGTIPRVVQLLEWAVGDPEASVREIAAATLGNIGARGAAATLRKALADQHPEVSFAAAKALWELGDPTGRSIFLEIVAGDRSNTHEGISGSIHEAKQRFRNKSSLATLGMNEAAGFALGPFALGLSLAEDLAKDGSAGARALCVSLLAADNDAAAGRALEEALADKSWIVRAAAAKALARRGDPRVLPTLQNLMNSDDRDTVRYMAAGAIVRLLQRREPLSSQGDLNGKD